jgi:excisionase family DNA binding protein
MAGRVRSGQRDNPDAVLARAMNDTPMFAGGSLPPVAALPPPVEDRSDARFSRRYGGIDLLTVDQVAERCHVSTKTVRRAIDRGELRASRLATRGAWVVRAGDFEAWLDLRANRPRWAAEAAVRAPTPIPGPGARPTDPADPPTGGW